MPIIDKMHHITVWSPTAYEWPNIGKGGISNHTVYHHPGSHRMLPYQGYNKKFLSCDIKSKLMWERTPTITEKLHRLSLVRQLCALFSPIVDSLFEGAFVNNVRHRCGRFAYCNKREVNTVTNQVSNKPPRRSSVKMPISACPYHCLKYPLIRKPNMLSVISGMAAPTDNASASK